MNALILFFVGLLFANGIPHFVHGVSGKKFPTPFAKPPGRGLSPAPVNALWGLANFLLAVVLLNIVGGLVLGFNPGFMAFLLGFVLASIGLSTFFQKADREYETK